MRRAFGQGAPQNRKLLAARTPYEEQKLQPSIFLEMDD